MEKTANTETVKSIEEPKRLAVASYNFLTTDGGYVYWGPSDIDKLETVDIENNFPKIIKDCRFYYRRDPIASTVVNKLVEISMTDIVFDKGDLSVNEFRIFEGIKDELLAFMDNCALEYLISGLVIPEIEYAPVTKEDLMTLGVKKYNSLELPISMWLRDPMTVKIRSSMIMDKPSYYVVLPADLVFFIMNEGKYPDGNKDLKLWTQLQIHYPEFIEQVKAGNKEVLLENDLITRRKPITGTPYPTPYLYSALESLRHKRNLRRMDYSLASRVITAIQLFNLGSDEYPVTEDDEGAFQNIKDQMVYRDKNIERIFQLFANHTLKISWIMPDITALLDDTKYREINQDIFFSLGFPKILTTGETEKTQNSDPELAMVSPVKSMENMQRKLLPILKEIVKQISIRNHLKDIPEVHFDKISLYSIESLLKIVTALYEGGNISRETLDAEFGYNFEEEIKKRSEEEKRLEELGVPAFSPKPFSPQPEVPGEGSPEDKKEDTKEEKPTENTDKKPQNK